MIYISAGHHNADPGAVGNGYKEADLNKELRNAVIKELDLMKVKYIIDKDSETNTQYQRRIKPGSGSVLFDIHFNSSSNATATGTEMIVAKNANKESKDMAKELLDVTVKLTGLRSRGVKTEADSHRGRLGILHTGAGISVLAEIAFISNKSDILAYKKALPELAKAYAKILKKYEDLKG